QRNTSTAAQQLGAAHRQALARLQQLQAWGLAEETDVSGANALRPFDAGGYTRDPLTGQERRHLPDGFDRDPTGTVRRIPGLAEQQQIVKNLERAGELGFETNNAALISARDRLKAHSTKAGELEATIQLGGRAAQVTKR